MGCKPPALSEAYEQEGCCQVWRQESVEECESIGMLYSDVRSLNVNVHGYQARLSCGIQWLREHYQLHSKSDIGLLWCSENETWGSQDRTSVPFGNPSSTLSVHHRRRFSRIRKGNRDLAVVVATMVNRTTVASGLSASAISICLRQY